MTRFSGCAFHAQNLLVQVQVHGSAAPLYCKPGISRDAIKAIVPMIKIRMSASKTGDRAMLFPRFNRVCTEALLQLGAVALMLVISAVPAAAQNTAPTLRALLDRAQIEDMLVDYYAQLGAGPWYFKRRVITSDGGLQEKITENKKSEVKMVNGRPKLYVGEREIDTASTYVYYFPEFRARKEVPFYDTEGWIKRMEEVIDTSKNNHTLIIMPQIWWSDVDKATARTIEPEKYYDFGSLDRIMDYSSQKGVYIMLSLSLQHYAPEWWLRENNFPPFNNKNKVCDFCETDSYGHVYGNPSMGSDVTEKDFGNFLKVVINRYKNHPALIGWVTGIGATTEDNYGPNYVMVKGNAGGLGDIERKPLMFTDYSPFFQRIFKDWIKNKYQTDKELQRAWNDKNASLDRVIVPPAKELVKNPDSWMGLFPEESQGRIGGDVDNLTGKGKDFYEFRTYMANKSREFYVDLFKSNDPSHIVILNASLSKYAQSNSRIDGFIRNDSLCFDCFVAKHREDQYAEIIFSIRRANEHKKLSFFGWENGSAQSDHSQPEGQRYYLTALGKAVKCAGGILGYVSDLASANAGLYPNWASSSAQKAISEINNYTPSSDCDCTIAKELWQKNRCDSGVNSGCQLLSKAYGDFCHVRVPGGGKCGDGVCDEIEKSRGMCPVDCKNK
jgi:hypothetical protein